MQYLASLLVVAATLAAAVPTNNTLIGRSDIQASINWFERYDCTNPCVEIGMCLAGQVDQGMDGSVEEWIGWDAGCWDRPDDVHSIALSVNNGHKFSGMDKSCAQWKADNFAAETWALKAGDDFGKHHCTTMNHEHIKAVFYHWED